MILCFESISQMLHPRCPLLHINVFNEKSLETIVNRPCQHIILFCKGQLFHENQKREATRLPLLLRHGRKERVSHVHMLMESLRVLSKTTFYNATSFCMKVFWPSAETFLTFSRFQYQNFLNTSLAIIFGF